MNKLHSLIVCISGSFAVLLDVISILNLRLFTDAFSFKWGHSHTTGSYVKHRTLSYAVILAVWGCFVLDSNSSLGWFATFKIGRGCLRCGVHYTKLTLNYVPTNDAGFRSVPLISVSYVHSIKLRMNLEAYLSDAKRRSLRLRKVTFRSLKDRLL